MVQFLRCNNSDESAMTPQLFIDIQNSLSIANIEKDHNMNTQTHLTAPTYVVLIV